MPGTKRPNRKPKKKRAPNETEKTGAQHRPGGPAGAKSYGKPKGGASFTSPAMNRGSARGG